jgi:Ser/Thr protein kinase RdoA (MazF antagonist)
LRWVTEQLKLMEKVKAEWQVSLRAIREGCEQLASQVPRSKARGLHGDFGPHQVLVDGPRLFLVGLDHYCKGDPALDAGSFLACLSEQAMEETPDQPDAFLPFARAFEDSFVAPFGAHLLAPVEVCRAIKLIHRISHAVSLGNLDLAQRLLEMCHQRIWTLINEQGQSRPVSVTAPQWHPSQSLQHT